MSATKLPASAAKRVEVIRQITSQITVVSAPFSLFGVVHLGSRATIVKLQNNALAVFSPVALTDTVRAATENLGGQVGYLVAPDYEHHIFLTQWAKAFPKAKVIGVDGLPEKRAKDPEHREVSFSHIFTPKERQLSIDEAFDREFDVEYVPAHGNKELVFNHKPSRTLIEADLIANLPALEQYSETEGGSAEATRGLTSKLINGMMTTKGDALWQKRILRYTIVKDKQDFSQSMKRIESWDWDRIIPCHGDVIETGGKAVFEKVMEAYLRNRK